MRTADKSVIISIVVAVALFVGAPALLWQMNYLILKQPEQVFSILIVTIVILGIKAFITYYAKQNFTFTDHGFQLCLLSAGGFLTMWGLQALDSSISLLGDEIQFGRTIFRLNNSSVILGGLVSLFAALLTALIVNRAQSSENNVGWIWRLSSYAVGIVNFAFYLVMLVSKGV